MAQDLRIIAMDEKGNILATVSKSTLAREAEKLVDELNGIVGTKGFDNLGLDTEIEFFDWARASKVEDIPTVAELIAQTSRVAEEEDRVSIEDTKTIIADGGNLLDLMYA